MKDILTEISRIRVKNNDLWMKILKIALKKAPKATKRLLKRITANDKEVSSLTGALSDENQRKKDRN
jgi:hypothetical protein